MKRRGFFQTIAACFGVASVAPKLKPEPPRKVKYPAQDMQSKQVDYFDSLYGFGPLFSDEDSELFPIKIAPSGETKTITVKFPQRYTSETHDI